MLIVPLQAIPAQTLDVVLGAQPCSMRVMSKLPGMFLDLYVNGALIVGGTAMVTGVRLVRDSYLGFVGDLIVNDTQPSAVFGAEDPQYSGLGARWQLLYLTPAELTGDV